MKLNYLFFGAMLLSLQYGTTVNAQSLKDILKSSTVKNAVTAVTGGQSLSIKNLEGIWTYVRPAVELQSDNALTNIAGTLASEELEKKMKDLCSKVGIEPHLFNYTFQKDSTFTSVIKGKTLNGTYTLHPDSKTIELHYGKFGDYNLATMKARVVLSGDQLSLLFEADKLLNFLSGLGSLSSNNSVQMVTQLAKQYDGMSIGFELKK